MKESHSNQHNSRKILTWLFSHLSPYKKQVIIALLALVFSSMAWLLLGQGIKQVIDQGFVQNNNDALTQALTVVLGVVLFGSVATYFRFYWMVWLGERVCADIRTRLFDHLLTLPPSFFETTRTGEIISRFTSDTTLLQSVVGTGISMTLRSLVMFIGSLALMAITSFKLTLLVFIAVPLMLLPIRVLGKKVRLHSKLSQDKVALVGGMIDESLHEIHTVQAYNHEQKSSSEFASKIENVMSQASKRIHFRALLISIVMVISLSAIFTVTYIGAIMVIENTISVGELTAFVFYAVLAGGAIATISEVIGELQKAAGASERIIDLLQQHSNIIDDGTTHINFDENKLNENTTIINVSNINFSYPIDIAIKDTESNSASKFEPLESFENKSNQKLTNQANKLVIKDVSFSVKKGEKVAIVGSSGAGKSTLFQLLLRFYDLNSGSIDVLGTNTVSAPLQNLREQFALVPQDAVIFAGNVLDNIGFSNPYASVDDIKNAAKLAYANEFIEDLPQQYNTELGERGIKLSGGQKQRIAIARAIVANRPILLLDEATSALDAASEQFVKKALDSLTKNKTTLIIAHRLSTVMNADKILVMEKGKIIDEGSHQNLYATSSIYKEFVDLQLVNEEKPIHV